MLGRTPEFAGIVSEYFGDSRIEMRKGPNNNDLQAKVCKARTVGQTSNLVRAMNTSEFQKYHSYRYILNPIAPFVMLSSKLMFLIRLTDTTLDVGNMTKNLKRANVKQKRKQRTSFQVHVSYKYYVITMAIHYFYFQLFVLKIFRLFYSETNYCNGRR